MGDWTEPCVRFRGTSRQCRAQHRPTQEPVALAFVRSELDGDVSALQAWPQRHTELLARFVAPASIAGFRTS